MFFHGNDGAQMRRRAKAVIPFLLILTVIALVSLQSLQMGSVAQEPVLCHGEVATILGTEQDDRIRGTRGPDVIVTFGGNDRVMASDGDDIICAGDGDDTVSGGKGNDLLDAGSGNDTVSGGRDFDTCIDGERNRQCENILVSNQPPFAHAGPDQTGALDEAITLDG